MSKAPRPPPSKHDGMYERNDKVLVARSNGGWTEAVVLNVDVRKREYSVCFSSGNKAVHKQISFDHARDHLLPPSRDQNTYYSKLSKENQAEVERICHEVYKGRDLQDTVQGWLRKRSGSSYLTPYAVKKLGRFSDTVGELLDHLVALDATSRVDSYKLVADWAAGKVKPLPAASSPVVREPLAASPPPGPSPSPVPPVGPRKSVERIEKEEESPEVVMSTSPTPGLTDQGSWEAVDENLQEIMKLAKEIRKNAQIGSPSDADIEQRGVMMKRRDKLKDKAAKDLQTFPSQTVPPGHVASHVEELVATLSREGDENVANLNLMRALVEHVDVSYAKVIESEGLLIEQCTDGNVEFFKLLLTCKGVHEAYDPVEIVASAVYSQTARVPLVQVVLTHVKYKECLEDVQCYFTEFFESITNESQRRNKEVLTGLYELLEELIAHDDIKIDLSAADSSEMTVLGRCCASGDLRLLELLLKHKPDIVLPTEQLPDGTTPMVQAIIKDKVDMVKRLLTLPSCEVDKESKLGTALGLAEAMKRTEIEKLLRSAGATLSKFNNE